MRRLRSSEQLRNLVRETRLDTSRLVAPIFVRYGSNVIEPVESMPGISRYSVDTVGKHVSRLADLGINSVLLFGIPKEKDAVGTRAYAADGIVPRAVRAIKDCSSATTVMTDVCLCEYTDHGHCGILAGKSVDNDRTLRLLAKASLAYAKAGADVVAPSAMMDHQVSAIRSALDSNGNEDTAIMGYSAKYASAFYGPFRSAAGSKPSFGDRRGYQMDMANKREAMNEIALDILEGADIVMVKPALSYLDVIAEARKRFDTPLAAYNVSGEYSMIKAAGNAGWINEDAAIMEVLTSIRRAGADLIITYHAEEAAQLLDSGAD